jgi:MFS family permease
VRALLARLTIDTTLLRTNPPFRRLWVGQTISMLGSEFTGVAIPFQMYELTGSTLQVGLLALTTLAPLLTMTLVGGALADALDRRSLLLRTETVLALTSGVLAVNACAGEPRIWLLYVLSFANGAAFSLGVAAMRSATPRLVSLDELPAATVLNGVYSNFGAVAGPAMAGLLISFIGLGATYTLDASSFIVSLWSVWTLPRMPAAHDADRASVRSIIEGFRWVRRHRPVLGIFLVDTNVMIFGMPSALFPAIGTDVLGGDAKTVGFLYGAPYAGALVATLLSGWATHVRRHGLVVCISASLWGVAIGAFGFADTLWLALVLLALAGAADYVSALFRSVMVQTVTPDPMRGRVSGIEFMQVAAAPTLGNVEAGVLASFTSIRFSVVSGGIFSIAGTALIALAIPSLLRYDAEEGKRAAAAEA